MAKVTKKQSDTPGGKKCSEAFMKMINDHLLRGIEPRFPSGTTFMAADLPDFAKSLCEERAENHPVAIIYPDGSEDFLPAR